MVSFSPRPGEQQLLLDLWGREVIDINRRFGALRVWALSGEPGMAIVSVWARADDLDAMRANPDYGDVLAEIRRRSQDLIDQQYELVAWSSQWTELPASPHAPRT